MAVFYLLGCEVPTENYDNLLDKPFDPQLLLPANEAVITTTNQVTLEWGSVRDAVE